MASYGGIMHGVAPLSHIRALVREGSAASVKSGEPPKNRCQEDQVDSFRKGETWRFAVDILLEFWRQDLDALCL